LNLAGYQLLARGRAADAVTLFSLNLEAFPASANAHDSLADAFLAVGDRDRALELSRKALDLLATDKASTPERRELIRQSAEQKIERLTKPD
jgi:tetratricopeptide (TPR) repeat protein